MVAIAAAVVCATVRTGHTSSSSLPPLPADNIVIAMETVVHVREEEEGERKTKGEGGGRSNEHKRKKI